MLAFNFFGATEGGLFDINATLPLMAIQVVALTYILNSLFFKPVGNVVEKREKFVSNNIIEAKNKLSEVEKLEAELLAQLQSARTEAHCLQVLVLLYRACQTHPQLRLQFFELLYEHFEAESINQLLIFKPQKVYFWPQ